MTMKKTRPAATLAAMLAAAAALALAAAGRVQGAAASDQIGRAHV